MYTKEFSAGFINKYEEPLMNHKTEKIYQLSRLNVLSFIETLELGSEVIQVASSKGDVRDTLNFLMKQYEQVFPDLNLDELAQSGEQTICFFTRDKLGNVDSTATVSWLGGGLIPGGNSYFDVKEIDNSTLKVGRFSIQSGDSTLKLKAYYKLFVELARYLQKSGILGLLKEKDLALHVDRFNAKALAEGSSFGGKYSCFLTFWELRSLDIKFYKWLGMNHVSEATPYLDSDWNEYAMSFSSIQTEVQRELQISASKYLYGDVGDFGCGCAKMALLVSDNAKVKSYVGIDASSEMLKIGKSLIEKVDFAFETMLSNCYIEEYSASTFDSAVCLNSYYSWSEPKKVLNHIYKLIKKGGVLVLATPNNQLDLLELDKQARKELLGHPDYEKFRKSNLNLINNREALLIEMHDLIEEVQALGFKVKSCHQEFYLGGVNFLVLKK